MRRWGVVFLAVLSAGSSWAQGLERQVDLSSPDGNLVLTVATTGPVGLHYAVRFRGKDVLSDSAMGLQLGDGRLLGPGMRVAHVERGSADSTWSNRFGKSLEVRDRYNSARLALKSDAGDLEVEARAYDDGVAFRYIVPSAGEIRVTRERTVFTLAADAVSWPLVLQNFNTPYEDEYVERHVSNLHPEWLIGLPFTAELPGRAWVAVTEADIENYPGMYLRHVGDFSGALQAELSPTPGVTNTAAVIEGTLRTPWRVVMVADQPGKLIESNIVLNLNPPSAIADASWIQPGKTAWDWWSGDVAKDVPFTPGMNTATMKYYIDFAAEVGLPYMLIDEGWAVPLHEAGGGERVHMADITRYNTDVDIPELVRYAKAKGVRLWLWAYWGAVDRYMDQAFALWQKWGIAGVKIDFMQRDDQWMTDWYRRVAADAAEHHLMVDFHGAFKPDGMERTYPNVLTREAVMGLEYSKWSALVTPVHNTTLPFTRMLAGPMDYTPGGFGNATEQSFVPRMSEPMVQATRAHELALYVIFQSAFQMLADTPAHYRGQPELEFLKRVPVVWDETRVLSGRPGQSVVIARRSGHDWYLGAITNWQARDLEIPLGFLGAGSFVAETYADSADAATNPTHTQRTSRVVNSRGTIGLHLAPGGGAAVWLHPR